MELGKLQRVLCVDNADMLNKCLKYFTDVLLFQSIVQSCSSISWVDILNCGYDFNFICVLLIVLLHSKGLLSGILC